LITFLLDEFEDLKLMKSEIVKQEEIVQRMVSAIWNDLSLTVRCCLLTSQLLICIIIIS